MRYTVPGPRTVTHPFNLLNRYTTSEGDMTAKDDWTTWLAANPHPDLGKLVTHWGGYEKIPEPAWDQFQADKDAWEDRRMTRLLGPRWKIKDRPQKRPPKTAKPGNRRPMS